MTDHNSGAEKMRSDYLTWSERDREDDAPWPQNGELHEVWQSGITYGVHRLAALLGVKNWDADVATESIEGDVDHEIGSILVAAKLIDPDAGERTALSASQPHSATKCFECDDELVTLCLACNPLAAARSRGHMVMVSRAFVEAVSAIYPNGHWDDSQNYAGTMTGPWWDKRGKHEKVIKMLKALASAPQSPDIDPDCCLGLTIEECSRVPTSQCDGHGSVPMVGPQENLGEFKYQEPPNTSALTPAPCATVTDEGWLSEFPEHYRGALRLLDKICQAIEDGELEECDITNEGGTAPLSDLIRLSIQECKAALSLSPSPRLTEGEMREMLAKELEKRDNCGVGSGVNMRCCLDYVRGLSYEASLHDRCKLDAALAFGNAIQDKTR